MLMFKNETEGYDTWRASMLIQNHLICRYLTDVHAYQKQKILFVRAK